MKASRRAFSRLFHWRTRGGAGPPGRVIETEPADRSERSHQSGLHRLWNAVRCAYSRWPRNGRRPPRDVEFLAVSDVYERRRQAGKDLTGAPHVYEEYRELLGRDDIDGVLIAVPDHWHYAMAAEACFAGKDVYVEKPMTYTLEEARQLSRVVPEDRPGPSGWR